MGVLREVPESNLAGLCFQEGAWTPWAPPAIIDSQFRVGLAADHFGMTLYDGVLKWLQAHDHQVVEYSHANDVNEVDYPGVAIRVAHDVRLGNLDRAVLLCGTGIGMAISATKVLGVRAATVSDPYSAERASASNDAQILSMGGQVIDVHRAAECLDKWFQFELTSERSLRKLTAILDYEEDRSRSSEMSHL
jgi:ribose 5-phosphate isomerase B